MDRKEPKIVLFDIEIMNDMDQLFEHAWRIYPGATMGANMSTIISFGYKIYGESGKAKCINVWDKDIESEHINDDKDLCKKIHEILDDADAVVSFYGKKFDIKHIDARLMMNGLPPLKRFRGKHIDLHQVAKQRLKLSHKRLNDMAKYFGCESKIDTGGFSLWREVYKGSKRAQNKMSKYCAQDVDVLEQVFKKMIPIITTLPTAWLYDGDVTSLKCPHCSSFEVDSKGFRTTKTAKYRRYVCRGCGTNFRTDIKNEKPRID
jgi:DNA polymerase elongation subunit (family B)